jgi:hypothetical protein
MYVCREYASRSLTQYRYTRLVSLLFTRAAAIMGHSTHTQSAIVNTPEQLKAPIELLKAADQSPQAFRIAQHTTWKLEGAAHQLLRPVHRSMHKATP